MTNKNSFGPQGVGCCNSGSGNTGNNNVGSWNTGSNNAGGWNTGHGNSGSLNTGHGNFGNLNSGHLNFGDANSGYGNTGSGNTGIFCTSSPTIRAFDVDTGKTTKEIDHPDLSGYIPHEFVPAEEMTSEEKQKYPNYSSVGGYLRTYDHQEMWRRGWAKDTVENKRKFVSLPNFDADKFLAITGIDVREDIALLKLIVIS